MLVKTSINLGKPPFHIDNDTKEMKISQYENDNFLKKDELNQEEDNIFSFSKDEEEELEF